MYEQGFCTEYFVYEKLVLIECFIGCCEQCESIDAVEKKLTEMGIKYVRHLVEEGGIYVDQLFFHDPDGFMVEICNCDKLPVIPLAGEIARSCSRANLQLLQPQQPQQQSVAQVPVIKP